jgi:hypothetical protein
MTHTNTGVYLRVLIPNVLHEHLQTLGRLWGVSAELAMRDVVLETLPADTLALIPSKAIRGSRFARLGEGEAAPAQPTPAARLSPPMASAKPSAADLTKEVERLSRTGLKRTGIAAKLHVPYAFVDTVLDAGKGV